MKRFLVYIFALLVPLFALAQTKHSIEIDASSFKPVNTDALTGVAIDKIEVDNSLRPCARIKLKVNRMTREDISNLQIVVRGGIHDVMKTIVAHEGNGLIIELTAKPQTRFYLHHDKYGDSNEVTLNLEGNKEYRLDAELCQMYSIVVSTNVIGADIYLDNELKGKSDDTYVLTINNIMAGSHKLRIEHEAMKHEQDIFVSDTNIHFKAELNMATSRPQYVVFQVEPKGAAIVIDDKSYAPDVDGVAMAVLHNGSHTYTVSAKDYHNESGTFVVSGAKVVKSVTLRPAHGWLNVSGSGALQGASVYVDGQLIGSAPVKSDRLASGTHTVRIVKSLYKAFEENVTITDGKTLDYAPSLVADFATVSLSVGGECDIYVNNEKKGSGSWRGDLATGAYIFEARKAGHTTTSISKTISAEPRSQSYTIPTPKPIMGTLNVMSSPAMADVYVDGKVVGQTPLMVDVIIGKHEVSLCKGELASETRSVNITEGQMVNLNLTLAQLEPKNANFVERVKDLNMKMVWVEGGTFQMGATSVQGSDVDSDETPVHTVTLDSYYIAECEVTQALWETVMGTTVYQQRDKANTSWSMRGTGDDYPMYYVSWHEATQFCEKLSQLTGKKYVLPTEAQWEYAARGGKHSRGYKYSGSNTIGDVAWYEGNSGGEAHSVMQKAPNELGLYDMSGNVYEWCSDWYGSYGSSSQINHTGPSSGTYRVLRGGSWSYSASYCRASNRSYSNPSYRVLNNGFRVVCLDSNIPNNTAVNQNKQTPSASATTQQNSTDVSHVHNNTAVNQNKQTPSASATTQQNSTYIETALDLNMKMVWVEGGTFQMGATSEQGSDAYDWEKPVHSVTLSSYYIAECEVTQAQWRKIMGSNPSSFTGDDSRPVEKVSWYDAYQFCVTLSELTGKTYALPTEAQWEYAARGGKHSKGYKYSGSNSIDAVAWYSSNSSSTTHSVKKKSPNELGLYDMSGNVGEWCNDSYSNYSSDSQTYPTGPSGSFRVVRGGSWRNDARGCRVSHRAFDIPNGCGNFYGFRVVCLP